MDPTVRFRIASHIHFALLRHYGEDVPVGSLLRGGEAAREALWVCEAGADAELADLARQLRGLLAGDAAARSAALRAAGSGPLPAAPQDAPWARNTSGFGVSRPADDAVSTPVAARPGWWSAAVGWRKRSGPRSPR